MKGKIRMIGVVAAGVVALGCAVSKEPPVPTAAMAAASGIPLETLRQGHGVYLTQCGGCHELVPPNAVKTSDWHIVMPGMCWNAGLTKADEALAMKYVLAAKGR
jgi:cytochrome c5